MSSSVPRIAQPRRFFNRLRNIILLPVLTALTLIPASARAQFSAPSPGTQVHDPSALKPPPGARVAIVEFVDMECPVCAITNPIVKTAAAKYRIPWLCHDFLIPYHAWSLDAAVNARWFDTKSKALGDEYRDQVFANQSSMYNPGVLSQFTAKFAQNHDIALPFAIDPQGKFSAEVKADSDLGRRTGVDHTPTVFIVTANSKGAPYIEVQHPGQQLYTVIDQALADTGSAMRTASPTPSKPTETSQSRLPKTKPFSPDEATAKPVDAQPLATQKSNPPPTVPPASTNSNPHRMTWLFAGSAGVFVVVVVMAIKLRRWRDA
ncbi:MAG: thioredoxin domain-containing protein [Terracidiphilus sp.]